MTEKRRNDIEERIALLFANEVQKHSRSDDEELEVGLIGKIGADERTRLAKELAHKFYDMYPGVEPKDISMLGNGGNATALQIVLPNALTVARLVLKEDEPTKKPDIAPFIYPYAHLDMLGDKVRLEMMPRLFVFEHAREGAPKPAKVSGQTIDQEFRRVLGAMSLEGFVTSDAKERNCGFLTNTNGRLVPFIFDPGREETIAMSNLAGAIANTAARYGNRQDTDFARDKLISYASNNLKIYMRGLGCIPEFFSEAGGKTVTFTIGDTSKSFKLRDLAALAKLGEEGRSPLDNDIKQMATAIVKEVPYTDIMRQTGTKPGRAELTNLGFDTAKAFSIKLDIPDRIKNAYLKPFLDVKKAYDERLKTDTVVSAEQSGDRGDTSGGGGDKKDIAESWAGRVQQDRASGTSLAME